MSNTRAIAAIKAASLNPQEVGEEQTEVPIKPIGEVVAQHPEEREIVPEGSTVTLFVSEGVYVPNVVGLNVSEAQSEHLPEALWSVTVTEAQSTTAEFDTIVTQDPPGDTYTDDLADNGRVKIALTVAPPSQKLIAALAAKIPAAPAQPAGGGRGSTGGGAGGGGAAGGNNAPE
jgi:beta-lactam-binding protein with PASTA domain